MSPSPRRTRSKPRRPAPLADLARAVLREPTASYAEHRIAAMIRSFAEERGLTYREDALGNAYVEYHRGRRRPPLVLGAHMDHPGFVVTGVRGRRLELEFRGGLSAQYGRGEVLKIYAGPGAPDAARDGGRAGVTSVQSQARTRGGPRRKRKRERKRK